MKIRDNELVMVKWKHHMSHSLGRTLTCMIAVDDYNCEFCKIIDSACFNFISPSRVSRV